MQVTLTSVVERLFPEYTKNWFHPKSRATPVPHNFYELDSPEKLGRCKSAFAKYIYELAETEPPEHWFSSAEFPVLFEELKHLIGEPSTTQGSGARNLTLGNLVLLLAASTSGHSATWLQTVNWEQITDEILPEQERSHSHDAASAMVSFLELLRADRPDSAPLIARLNLTDVRLQIWLNVDCTNSAMNRLSLIEQILKLPAVDADLLVDEAYTFYRKFLVESAINKYGGREARCVVNLQPLKNQGSRSPAQTLLEVVSCK